MWQCFPPILPTALQKKHRLTSFSLKGAVESVSAELKLQLADGGRIVCVEPVDGVDVAVIYTKKMVATSRAAKHLTQLCRFGGIFACARV